MSFESFTQYDNRFNEKWKRYSDSKKGFACPYFSLITAYRFLKDGDVSKQRYEDNVTLAIQYCTLMGVTSGINFHDFTSLTNIPVDNIMCTNVELIVLGDLGFDKMIPQLPIESDKRHVIVFLKNGNFLTVLVDKNGYYIRDCHESCQRFALDFDNLVALLSSIYQFTEVINIEGIQLEAYSSIEFLQISDNFSTDILSIMGVDETQITLHKLDFNDEEFVAGYIETDDRLPRYIHNEEDNFDESIFNEILHHPVDVDIDINDFVYFD